ncbi:integrator complex subunit 9, partial [Plakobranchus ocellatus]
MDAFVVKTRDLKANDKSKCSTKTVVMDRHAQFPKETHVAGQKLFCTSCNLVDQTRKSSVSSHLGSGNHKLKRDLTEKSNQPAKKQCVLTESSSSVPSTVASQAPLRDAINPRQWKKLYTQHDVDSALAKVKLVGFSEKLDIFGALTITPTSSGYCIGSCNWIINSKFEKICYVAGTSTLTTHPRPVDQTPLKNADILILSCLTQTPLSLPDSMIGEFCINAAVTVKNGGNVLVPCYASGLLSKGRLKNFSSIHTGLTTDFHTPCIMFAGHPSLRMGDIVHLIELWGNSSANTIIFTEPDFPHLDALAPFLPVAMRVCYCPIDTSLNFSQANKLIRELRPLHLVVSETYTRPPVLEPMRNDLTIEFEPSPLTYKQGEIVSLPVKRQYETVHMQPE